GGRAGADAGSRADPGACAGALRLPADGRRLRGALRHRGRRAPARRGTSSAGNVLAIFAHPDDESLLAGGTLAASAAAGLDVTIVSVTRGEAGPIGDRSVGRERLGEVREQELRAAARELGAARARCL